MRARSAPRSSATWRSSKSSRPRQQGGEVLLPGEPERRAKAERASGGISVDPTTWDHIMTAAEQVGLDRAALAAQGGLKGHLDDCAQRRHDRAKRGTGGLRVDVRGRWTAACAGSSGVAANCLGDGRQVMAEVDIRKVDKFFGSTQVLHGVEIGITDGEFVVLVGPSGCGKSTLLRMIAGLEEISKGDIAIGGRVVNNVPPKDRDIAMVFQNYALYPHMTVFNNMAFSLKLAKAPKDVIQERVGRAASILGLTELPRALSAPAFGRSAPARRDGPGDRARPGGVPVRRAALQPRRQAARADAHRDQGAASAAQDHRGLRHPRPDRGDDHGRSDRGAARRRGRAGRRPAAAVRRAGESVRGRLPRLAGDELSRRHHQAQRRRADGGDRRTVRRCRCPGRPAAGTASRWSTASGPSIST